MLIIFLSAAAFCFAQERIIDNAGVLSAIQKTALNSRINSISSKYNFDLVILTEKSVSDNISLIDYADEFFYNNGYGQGQNRDGSLFLQVTDSRDYCISNTGRGIKILNDYAFNKLESDMLKFLRSNNNYDAYNSFLSNWEEFLLLNTKWGRNYNFFYRWNIVLVIISWLIAFAIGAIVVASWKSKMNTAIAKTQASAYIVPGSLEFKVKNDTFLYSAVTKSARPENNSGAGGRTLTSSSGRSVGRSGKY